MKPMSFPFVRRCVVVAASAIGVACAPARANDETLPPERPTTPYEAQIRNTFSITRPGGGSSGGDTLDIRVSDSRLYEHPRIMGDKSVIVDTRKREVIEFDEKGSDKTALKFTLNAEPIPYIDGRTALAAFDPEWPAPVVAGKDKVAGEECTILHYGKPDEDGIAACVSKQGVVMRAKIVFPGYEREFEAFEFDAGKQDEKHFAPPKGFKVEAGEE